MQLIHMIDGIFYDVVWNGGPLLPDREGWSAAHQIMIEAPGIGWGRVTRERAPRKKKRYLKGESPADLRFAKSKYRYTS
jgi:hypothetical protein